MAGMTWTTNANSNVGPGPVLSNYTTPVDITPQPAYSVGLDQGVLEAVGASLELTAYGVYSSASAVAPNSFGIYWGGVLGTALWTNTTLAAGTATAWQWTLNAFLRVTQVNASSGASPTFLQAGYMDIHGTLMWPTAVSTWATILFSTVAAWPGTAVNLRQANAVTIGAGWATAATTSTIQTTSFYVASLN